MKVDIETIKVDQELTTEIDFNDYAINKLRIKDGKRKDIKFKNNKLFYGNIVVGSLLVLRICNPLRNHSATWPSSSVKLKY